MRSIAHLLTHGLLYFRPQVLEVMRSVQERKERKQVETVPTATTTTPSTFPAAVLFSGSNGTPPKSTPPKRPEHPASMRRGLVAQVTYQFNPYRRLSLSEAEDEEETSSAASSGDTSSTESTVVAEEPSPAEKPMSSDSARGLVRLTSSPSFENLQTAEARAQLDSIRNHRHSGASSSVPSSPARSSLGMDGDARSATYSPAMKRTSIRSRPPQSRQQTTPSKSTCVVTGPGEDGGDQSGTPTPTIIQAKSDKVAVTPSLEATSRESATDQGISPAAIENEIAAQRILWEGA